MHRKTEWHESASKPFATVFKNLTITSAALGLALWVISGTPAIAGQRAPGTNPSLCPNAFNPPTASAVALSTCTPNQKGDITIGTGGCGPDVYVDRSFIAPNGFRKITIGVGGQLVFPYDPGFELDVSAIVINSGGTFEVGNSQCPIGFINKSDVAEVNFTDPATPFAANGAIKGITVNQGGTLQLYGATGVAAATPMAGANPQAPSWTYLTAPAGPSDLYGAGMGLGSPVAGDGDLTLQVADYVDWQTGQWIVVAGTDYSPDGAEFVQIDNVSCTGPTMGPCTITLDSATPLKNYHFGGAAPDLGMAAFSDGAAQNYGVDERAEVGLISRNVKLTSTVESGNPSNGGEIRILKGYTAVQIRGAELEKFGKGALGSYPIHFHKVGNRRATTLVDSNSIHHSYNHCITLHNTDGLTISNNVCARIVDHMFYAETGNETGNTFTDNLGIGAMSNGFTITGNPGALAAFWNGDNLAQLNGYNGFNIPFSDSNTAVMGSFYTPSGFWITNPGSNTFIGNSIAGCQDQGRGFWMLPAGLAKAEIALSKGNFKSNRAHGCYTGFDTAEDIGVSGASGYIPQTTCLAGNNVGKPRLCDAITEFDNLTATRNRNRGIWVRASWYDIESPRLALNRDSVSLVSSGGTEGSPPGEWSRLNDAIVVGVSTNNPNRFGPCPYNGQNGAALGGVAGCYETIANQGNGYPDPKWNIAGVMFYDGPARIENTRFVNFKANPTSLLTLSDQTFLNYYESSWSGQGMTCDPSVKFKYEGDAAMGWFQSNVNSYPPTQYTENLSYDNVDLRHEIYTQSVENTCAPSGSANFRDGDKFTVILDHDASLSGLEVVPQGGGPPVSGVNPISLNNLPFLSGPGTVDECHSTGGQDKVLEGRPTSLISPYNYATLEFEALTNNGNDNVMVFNKDQIDYPGGMDAGQIQFTDQTITNSGATFSVNCGDSADSSSPGVLGHACVALSGRNGQGVYEPKLVNGLGYTVGAQYGMPNFVSLMFGDANLPGGISATNPFRARIGVCYKNKGATMAPPASAFSVYKGSKSFAGPDAQASSVLPYYTELACNGFINTVALCPASQYYTAAGSTLTKTKLTSVSSIDQIETSPSCTNGTCYYYDQTSGLLFIDMVQEQPNAGGPYTSPLGSCSGSQATSDPACATENFYSCPGPGCELYTIHAKSKMYKPGKPSDCTPYAGAPDYTQPYPADLNQLAYASDDTVVTTVLDDKGSFPHQAATNAPANLCPVNAPAIPDWPPPATVPNEFFQISAPAGVKVTLSPTVSPIPSVVPLYPLVDGMTYTVTADATGCVTTAVDPTCVCEQKFTISGGGWTSASNPNCCQLGTSGTTTIAVADGPYACAGPTPTPTPTP
jgi:hypothetical protein